MIYILLVLITVGVLLISREGKKILEWAGVSLVVGGTIAAVSLVLFIVVSFLRAHTVEDIFWFFLASLIPLGIVIVSWRFMRWLNPSKRKEWS